MPLFQLLPATHLWFVEESRAYVMLLSVWGCFKFWSAQRVGMGETRNQGKKGPKRRFILKLRSKKKGCRPLIMIGHRLQQSVKKINWRRLLRARAFLLVTKIIKVCCLWLWNEESWNSVSCVLRCCVVIAVIAVHIMHKDRRGACGKQTMIWLV